ncbi:family 20 glycosylhydrolase [Pedobacter sp. HMWF019]|uniref:family 20 glycosylhydrolase n=1 Tax=Pedobacter sp. HMWF019 TaxID=2056856 RepID=UPI001304D114|nr:family 20 glycosylhydrolase [Pedobacter sp. HMWF019]
MKLGFFAIMSLLFCLINLVSAQEKTQGEWKNNHSLSELSRAPIALIPYPQEIVWTNQNWKPTGKISVVVDHRDQEYLKNAIRSLSSLLGTIGIEVDKEGNTLSNKHQQVSIRLDSNLVKKSEGYQLEVSAKGVSIVARDVAGAFYAVQTLGQLLKKNGSYVFTGCKVNDWPAFSLRGFMHDTGRNFQELDMLKAQLDRLAAYKYNTFHWHLTDNPAWRPESKVFPKLNKAENRKSTRDPEKSYSFEEIRELIRYAGTLNIRVIPELDMPGHSAYFKTAFGFTMNSEQGMKVLEQLIDEFCKEIPKKDCPVIHLGSDEIHIPNPQEFIARMSNRVEANGRKVMVWNPGLKGGNEIIEQLWYDDVVSKAFEGNQHPYVDSYAGYLNSYDALTLIQRYFFQQVCNRPYGNHLAMGGILCCWPDTRVDDKRNIYRYNPVWPGMLTYSEALWCGRPEAAPQYMKNLPAPNTEAGQYFKEFENRLSAHRDLYFQNDAFPFVQYSQVKWQLAGPSDTTLRVSESVKLPVFGGVQRMEQIFPSESLKNEIKQTVTLFSEIYSAEQKTIHAWVGFETAVRSNRRSAGIPASGKWDANGGKIYINDVELPGPKWQQPGANRYLEPTWEKPGNEIPYTDEEFYWTRQPADIQLKKGWNTIKVTVPRTYADQAWMFAFVPVKKDGSGKWIEDLSVEF